MLIQTKTHTIFLLIGPTECGKTTFSKEVLMKQLGFEEPEYNFYSNVQYISSDDLRQEILGHDYDKYDQIMLEASNIAFPYLRKKLEFVTTYPVAAEFVIVDTTGLAKEFRQEILEIAKAQNYNIEAVIFDYKNRDDFYASERSRRLISTHIQRLKREVLPALAKENYHAIHRIPKKDFSEIEIEVTDKEEYLACILPPEETYTVVGDIHECVETFQALLTRLGHTLTDGQLTVNEHEGKLILNGDWIDKGKQTAAIIEFLYANREHFLLTVGNHEHFVYHYLKGEIKGVDLQTLNNYFDSIPVLQKDTELREKFFTLVEQAKPFYRRIGGDQQSFIVTHAPCKQKYLGKLNTAAKRRQRNFRLDREKPIEPQLMFLETESYFNLPLHIFGHVASKEAFRLKNKRSIDTGAVANNRLTAVKILPYKTMLYSVATAEGEGQTEELPLIFSKPKKPSWQTLPEDQQRRLRYMAKNKVQYLSGTMSPSAADLEKNELESLEQGLNYFKENGVNKVVLQPKYMGSRCNIYLSKDIDQCFAISRNGYIIQRLDLTAVYQQLLQKFEAYMTENDIETLLLDGELMPWSAMGQGLIEKEYQPIALGIEKELAMLQESGFEQTYQQAIQKMAETEYKKDWHHKDKKTLSTLYGSYAAGQFGLLTETEKRQVPMVEQEVYLETYKKQIELYGYEGELIYKPFNLLKIIYTDGQEEIPAWATSAVYPWLSEDPYLVLDLTQDTALEEAQSYFQTITVENQMEGVVIKPDTTDNDKTAPFMKVRNTDYLTLIYGYDYLSEKRYSKLIADKKIKGKLAASIKEAKLAEELLKIPKTDISEENSEYMDLLAGMIFEFEKERDLDPRL
ncbi:metallophosphoesterase [Enterococcus sp. BWR-S5]|uniref:metallophosphoesterase n=1 Tax=Enterococcus sp. BWR-S5 TaxID=2787714 RepID=UPI0019221E85|nr:metallophosphoesterase [Enterococcus sp. BWR-S5]MBL1223579.1 metallophosphoesterase [Enterococcus sp. BWR-S5]